MEGGIDSKKSHFLTIMYLLARPPYSKNDRKKSYENTHFALFSLVMKTKRWHHDSVACIIKI